MATRGLSYLQVMLSLKTKEQCVKERGSAEAGKKDCPCMEKTWKQIAFSVHVLVIYQLIKKTVNLRLKAVFGHLFLRLVGLETLCTKI